MCKLAWVHFADSVTQERRRKTVATVIKNSWDMGNTHGVGLVTWSRGVEPVVARSLKLDTLELPAAFGDDVLVHARYSTNDVCIENTHPYVGGGAYLVHNGIVRTDNTKIRAACKTNNDTELILKAYLSHERNLRKALRQLGGLKNVMVWDNNRQVLSIYPDNADFPIWVQDGVSIIAQDLDQVAGVIQSGLGHPFERSVLKNERVYEIDLGKDRSWQAAVEEARSHAKRAHVPVLMSQAPKQSAKQLRQTTRQAKREARLARVNHALAKDGATMQCPSTMSHGPHEWGFGGNGVAAKFCWGLTPPAKFKTGAISSTSDTQDRFVTTPRDKQPSWVLGRMFYDYRNAAQADREQDDAAGTQ